MEIGVELANAIFEYIEIFHNRQRRYSGLDDRTPIEYELLFKPTHRLRLRLRIPTGNQSVGQVGASICLVGVTFIMYAPKSS